MAALGPWVIERETSTERSPCYLGPHGWVMQRRFALSFDAESQAQDWLSEARKATPHLVAGNQRVSEIEIEDEVATGRAIASDYDPYGVE